MDEHSGGGELPDPLAAATAARRQVTAVGDGEDLGDLPLSGRHHRSDGGRLGAGALREGCVLDVAADVDRPRRGTQRGTDAEA